MRPIEKVIMSGIEQKLVSFAEWQSATPSASASSAADHDLAGRLTAVEGHDAMFAADLPAGPAWDMLIYLFVMQANERSASTAGCCRAGGVSTTEGARYLEIFASEHIVILEGDWSKRGERMVRLASRGRALIERALHNFITSHEGARRVAASRSVEVAFENACVMQEIQVSLHAVGMHRANLNGRRR